jgi:hypothetical protein
MSRAHQHSSARTPTLSVLACLLASGAAACTGYVQSSDQRATDGKPFVPPPRPPDDPITGPIASAPGPSSRLQRLSHKQWANTVGDLFHLEAPATAAQQFLAESVRSTFDNDGSRLEVASELWQDYQKAAEAVASQVARDAKLLAGITPANAPADAAGKARAFVVNLGLRAYRRPLTDAESNRYLALFNQGPALLGSGNAFADGAELVISYLLQSPHFLYRTELGGAVVNGKVALGDHEIASRLSYGLANTMPDEALFAAAAQQKLHTREDVLAHAQRLLGSPGGRATLRDFHEQLFGTAQYSEIKRDPKQQPAWQPGLGDDMRRESELFLEDVVFDRARGVAELLTAPYTFVNSKLASLYGVPAPAAGQPDRFVRVDLDPRERAGLFTQIGFLGSNDNATDVTPRPIMRGVQLSHDVLCVDLPAPPNVPPLPPQSGSQTNRQLVAAFTEQPGSICASCHATLINPLGFAFETYDALGKHRTQDNGAPVDAKARYRFAEGERSFDGAVELMGIIAQGQQAHDCYARHLVEYLYGRDVAPDSEADARLIGEAGRRSKRSASVKALILDLVTTDAFLSRLP